MDSLQTSYVRVTRGKTNHRIRNKTNHLGKDHVCISNLFTSIKALYEQLFLRNALLLKERSERMVIYVVVFQYVVCWTEMIKLQREHKYAYVGCHIWNEAGMWM